MSVLTDCTGNGRCFSNYICDCGCYDECDCDIDECECNIEHKHNCLYTINPEHKKCIIFCMFKPECVCGCVLHNCGNYFICKNKMPTYILDKNEGLCDGCYFQLGKLEEDVIKDCCICLEIKKNIKLTCGHSTCFECFEEWSFVNEDRPCPLCRNNN
jgi:hypothetical protein